jgi:hypothetical protein
MYEAFKAEQGPGFNTEQGPVQPSDIVDETDNTIKIERVELRMF